MSSFNCKTAHFFLRLQFSPLILQNCILVLISFFYGLVQVPRRLVQVQMSQCNWFRVHMAAYIRPRAVLVKEGPQSQCQVTNRIKFSLSIQLDQDHNKLRKLKNNFTNPNRFQKQIQYQIHGIHGSSQRFNDESSSLSQSSAIRALNPSPKATNSIRSQRDEIEKKRERISKVSNRRRRRITGSISDFKPKSQTESSSKNPEGSSSNLRRKHRWESNLPHLCSKTLTNLNQHRSASFKRVWYKKYETLKFSRKT